MKSKCSSAHKFEIGAGAEIELRCELDLGHRSLHSANGYSWPDENSLNPNRPLNPAELRSVLDLISSFFGLIGMLLIILGLVLVWMYGLLGFLACFMGIALMFGGYRIWSRSLRV